MGDDSEWKGWLGGLFSRRNGQYYGVFVSQTLSHGVWIGPVLWSIRPTDFVPWSLDCMVPVRWSILEWSCGWYVVHVPRSASCQRGFGRLRRRAGISRTSGVRRSRHRLGLLDCHMCVYSLLVCTLVTSAVSLYRSCIPFAV